MLNPFVIQRSKQKFDFILINRSNFRYIELMKLASALLLPLLICTTSALGQANWQSAEREKLLAGVDSLTKLGSPGPVAIWGNYAFPVIAAAENGKAELALCAAAGFGKGKALIFGQNSYLTGDGSAGVLLLNAVRWASGKEKPRIGLKGVKLEAFFDSKSLRAKVIDGPLLAKSLNDFDVVIANVQGLTDDAEGQAVQDYIKGGGGFIAGMTGWAFEQTSGGKTLSVAHGLNKALMPIGIAFTDSSGFSGAELRSFAARKDLPRFMNAYDAITAMQKQRQGGPALTPEDINQGASAIQIAMAAQPPGRTTLQTAVMSALGDGGSAVPTAEKPLKQSTNAAERIRLGMETRVLKLAAGEAVSAHAAATTFPGLAPTDAPRVTREISIDPNIGGWHSTGLWVNAGEPLQIAVPADIAGKGYAVRIGCHTDTLYHLDEWKRAPDISRSVSIEEAVTRTASAFGGLVYIEVPSRAAGGKGFTVTIGAAVEAPLFVLGKTTDAEWNSTLKKHAAPWAEFACDKLILSCPTEAARTVSNPTQLMEFWKKVVEAQDDITNQSGERKRPERIVADVQISAGYMHSGYPIMIPTSASLEMVTFGRLKFPGWGFYHEIGHNHQRGDFTFQGTGEVTNNVIGMYCYHEVLKKDWLIGHTAITEEERRKNIQEIKQASDKWQTWKSDPFLALTTYIQLVQEFGWESWRAYLHSFADAKFGPAPDNDDQARDQFLVRYSKITNKNLGPFFEFWGIPVSSSAKAEVSKLEAWMPKGL